MTWILTNGERLSTEDFGMEETESVGDVDVVEDVAEDEKVKELRLVGRMNHQPLSAKPSNQLLKLFF